MKRIIVYVLIILAGAGLYSCQEEVEGGGTAAEKLAGEWWFALLDEDGNVVFDYSAIGSRMSTYNTADNSSDEIWVDDFEHGWWVKAKVPANADNLTFGSPDSVFNVYEQANIIVSDGQIFEDAGTSKDGNVVDSIRFTATYPDGTVFIYAGHRHTGFLEDDYH